MRAPWDVVVIGGGPVGLVAALQSRSYGLSVAVIEPRLPPIDKACGEGIMPAGLATLARLGVFPSGSPIRGIRYLRGQHCAQAALSPPGLGVRRTTLHAALVDAARDAGVEWFGWAAGALRQDESEVLVPPRAEEDAEPVRARYALIADGLHSPQRRWLGLEMPRRGCRRGLRQHYRTEPWTDHVEVHWGEHAEAYVTPLPGQIGLALLTARRGSFEEHLQQFPALAERLRQLQPVGQVRGAGPFGVRARRRVAGRALLIGDAAGYVDAITGEGLSLGFAQAAAAVQAIHHDQPQRYEAHWRAITLRSSLPTAALVQATRLAPVRRLLVPAAATAPGLFAACVAGVATAGTPGSSITAASGAG
ncbi:NAD(P)/FAD-dependent oxidoreductase [Gephyromycinifex aptenodytis]|uniref:NAD(P)/FAD-dependent oxidoreductase n=1 Tax=Gephyromycinifex aptenodytis TaxID=2716227 RepID=UPI001B2FED03|nr:FAD-dependent monooxygenase [Gephyromycinifex aptenodytis]